MNLQTDVKKHDDQPTITLNFSIFFWSCVGVACIIVCLIIIIIVMSGSFVGRQQWGVNMLRPKLVAYIAANYTAPVITPPPKNLPDKGTCSVDSGTIKCTPPTNPIDPATGSLTNNQIYAI